DGSDRRPLTSGVDLQPNWSPDGTKVVFMRWVLHQPCTRYCDPYISYELWTVNADGTDERRITSPPAGSGDGNPVWSPDGTRILFIHTDGGVRAGLFVINPDGTDVQPVQPGF